MQIKYCNLYNLSAVHKNITRNVSLKRPQNVNSGKSIPGPPSVPFLGSLINFLPGGKLSGYKSIELCERLHKLYGPIVRLGGTLGGYDTVYMFDPEAVEHVLKTEDMNKYGPVRINFGSLSYYHQRQRRNKVDHKRIMGLGMDNGEPWKILRSKVSPILMLPTNIKIYADVISEIADDMVKRLKLFRDENNKLTCKINEEMKLYSLESVGMVTFGQRLNCLDPDLPEDSPVRQLIQASRDFFYLTAKLDYGPSWWKFYPTRAFKEGMRNYERLDRLTKYFIDHAIEKIKSSKRLPKTPNSEKPIIEKLLELDVETAYILGHEMLMGGIDTVGNTITIILYLLATNPEKQDKLREEILSKQDESYLKACIKEAMRVLPVSAIGNSRLTTKEYNLLGYKLPKDVIVVFAHTYMPLMDEHFPRAREFIPERWLTHKEDPLYYGNCNSHVYSPFGYGVRTCAGRRIAQLEMETMVKKIVENFQIEWTSPEPLQQEPAIINHAKGPFYFAFKDLQSSTN